MASRDDSSDLIQVENLLRNLSSQPSVRRLSIVVDENAKLRKSVDELTMANAGVVVSINRLTVNLDTANNQVKKTNDQLQAAQKNNQILSARLAEAENVSEASKKRAEELEVNFKKEREAIEQRLEEKEDELERLEEFTAELKPVSDPETLKNIRSTLHNIYTSSRELVDKYFGPTADLSSALLSNESLWDGVNLVNIPIPSSNSPIAKQMRVAAVISMLAHELCNSIFQPTYLLREASGLNQVLNALARHDPDLESHLRAVLLCATNTIKDVDDPIGRAWGEVATSSVYPRLSKLIPEAKRMPFHSDLQAFFTKACNHWTTIQHLDDRIVPELGSSREAKRRCEWKLLPLDIPAPSTPTVTPKGRGVNGMSSSSQGPSKPPATAKSHTEPNPDIHKDAIAIWPAFYNLSSETNETLVEGFVLHLALTKAAEAEQEAILEQNTKAAKASLAGSHRGERARRRMSVGVHSKNGAGSDKSFLSQASGGGQKVA